MLYPDSRGYGSFGYSETVIAELERRCGVKQVKTVVSWAREAKRQAQTARS